MKQIKVPLTPREWAEKRFSLLIADISNPNTFIGEDAMDDYIEQCGFCLLEEPETKPEQSQPSEPPTDKVEAVKYFLNQLPHGYKERALAQVDEDRVNLRDIVKDIARSIDCFNIWDKTKEGAKFWGTVYNHYFTPTIYPTLPPLPNDEKSTNEWTGYFTHKGERVMRGSVHQIDLIRYWIIEEKVGDQSKFIALDNFGKKHYLNNLFKYHKP